MRLIGCAVMKTEVEAVLSGTPDGDKLLKQAGWLPPGLHVDPEVLKEKLAKAVSQGDGPPLLVYGACCPDIDDLASKSGGRRIAGKNCIELLLGPERAAELSASNAFVMSPGWLSHWRSIFVDGLGWDETDARMNFGFYDRIVVLDFGLEPLDDMALLEFFDYTGVPVEIEPADLEAFKRRLSELLADDSEE